MATISKRTNKDGSLRYKAEVYIKGHRRSRSFATKREAQKWAKEYELAHDGKMTSNAMLKDILIRYRDTVSIKKRAAAWEVRKINFLLQSYPDFFNTSMENLSRSLVANWRDKRVHDTSSATVNREWTVLSHAVKVAIQDWEAAEFNPFSQVRRPSDAPPRDRLITDHEINTLVFVSGYHPNKPCETTRQITAAMFLFSLETAMRAQEICNLTWADIDGRVAHVRTSKTRSGVRSVPLSTRAIQIIDQMRKIGAERVFNVQASTLSVRFANLKKRAGNPDYTFHDARATAITRLAKKLDILDLARMIGHANLSQLMVYYRQTAEQLADKLD